MKNVALMCVALLVVGCDDGGMQPADPVALLPGVPAATGESVWAGLVVERWTEETLTVLVGLDSGTTGLGAYQGRILFNPEALELQSTELPQAGWHVVNREGAKQGLLRFAGFKPDGFEDPRGPTLDFEIHGKVSERDLTLTMEVVGTTEGGTVDASQVKVPTRLYRKVQR